ncbi:hybrid sensor histidine kinase/response regulator [Moorena sp. SIO3H5]|uniref:hybrid sensor histidine kinase/response regulator n=1 Tax=Moorena sp. SIO3H5 TaxID=2607834 RepID=UPI0013BB8236|nr:hybrid sensor histidine kinase/response regulator [Moorena sp. SIO3H5]NEO68231.1 hybrid sensor histidine kinase/response regulator [Moorena sp. SIO3H5]
MIEDEELRNIYKITSEERLQKLEIGLLHLEKYPQDNATLEQLLREAHSLKGDSRIAGIEDVETLIHGVEDILGSIKRQQIVLSPQVSDRLYQVIDAMGLLVYEAATGSPSGVDTPLMLDYLMAAVSQPLQPDQEAALQNGNVSQPAPTVIEDEDLRDIYKITSEERLEKLEVGLLHLEKYPQDNATLDKLLWEAQSLKGDSKIAGIENVETLAHGVENIIDSIKCEQTVFTPQVSDRIYQAIDAIRLLVYEAVTGSISGVDIAEILDHLITAVPDLGQDHDSPPDDDSTPQAQVTQCEPSEATIEESPLLPTVPLLPNKTPLTVTQEVSSNPSEPYRIDTIRVPTSYLDALITQTGELTVTKIAMAHAMAEIEEVATLWEEWKAFHCQEHLDSSSIGTNSYVQRLEQKINSLRSIAEENTTRLNIIAGELDEKIRTLRLLPLFSVFQLFPRMVRDLARQQSKEVELIIEGGETTADKSILEEIKDPLMHMVRNAIDHGIETPTEREKLGKSAAATIWLRGYQRSNTIVIEVVDDGRGLDIDKIKQTAVQRGLCTNEELELMTPRQIHALILAPGFSTRTFITEISGRGIGLDVLRTKVEQLNGNIEIESTPGLGSTFRLQLRTTLSSANVLLVDVQGIIHGLPIEFVETTLLVSREQIFTIEGRETIALDGQAIAVANLADLLELSNSIAYTSIATVNQQKSDLRPCILLKVADEQFGLFIDDLLDTQEVVIKPQSQLLKRVRNVSGATILGTGEICMILNPPDLLTSLQSYQPTTSTVSTKLGEIVESTPVILLVDDSITVRTQEKRILEKAGYEVVTAVDGLDGYHKLNTRHFDAVISDVEMPNLDGFSLTARIRQHQEYNELPIILVTSLASEEHKKQGADAGANAYITKGNFNQDVLIETLQRLV